MSIPVVGKRLEVLRGETKTVSRNTAIEMVRCGYTCVESLFGASDWGKEGEFFTLQADYDAFTVERALGKL